MREDGTMTEIEKAIEQAKDAIAYDELKAAHNRVLRQLEKIKRSEDEYTEAVYRAARDAAAGMTIKAVPSPKPDKRKNLGELAAVLLVADWQVGKITPDYSTEVASSRVSLLAKKVEQLVAIQRTAHRVREANVFLLGDLVEGEDIFPGQAHLIDSGLYGQIFSTAEMLAGLVRSLASHFEKVNVFGVIGNHGRIGRWGTSRPESNADAIAYKTAAMLTRAEKRITWKETYTQGERHWNEIVPVTVEGITKKWFLFHGDQLKASMGFPFYSLNKKLGGWNLSIDRFDYAAFGHWHTPARLVAADGKLTAWAAGSIESSNTYAQEWLSASGDPAQWLLFQSRSGISAEYLIRLGDSTP
jgi:hypothetical protein